MPLIAQVARLWGIRGDGQIYALTADLVATERLEEGLSRLTPVWAAACRAAAGLLA